jgi:hypothetical protein
MWHFPVDRIEARFAPIAAMAGDLLEIASTLT